MSRERNKPEKSWLAKAREELANQEEFTIERAYELGKIRGQKETIDKACEVFRKWQYSEAFCYDFCKAMEK